MQATDVVKLLDTHTNEQVTYYPVTNWVDGSVMDDTKVDNVIYRKAGTAYYKRAFADAINVKWFGATGDGSTDDTAAIRKTMEAAQAINIGMVAVPAGTYLINDLQMVGGISLVGFGGDTYCASSAISGQPNYPNPSVTKFLVASGGNGITCDETNSIQGGNLENVAIQGCSDMTSVFGLKITNLGWSTKNVSIDYFPTGVGLWIGWSWRAAHHKLQIRRCGLAMYLDGSIGAVNGLSFVGLLIENSCAAIYQKGTSAGNFFIGNVFTSAIIEGICPDLGCSFPAWIPIDSSVLADLGMTQNNFCGGVVLTGNAHLEFTGIYTELIGGITLYIGGACSIDLYGGFLSQTTPPSSSRMGGYNGGLSYSRIGSLNAYGTSVQYIDDATVFSSPLFTYTSATNNFQNINFVGTTGLNTRNIYGRYNISNISTSPLRWEGGYFFQQTRGNGTNRNGYNKIC